jgi:hypothetical protein
MYSQWPVTSITCLDDTNSTDRIYQRLDTGLTQAWVKRVDMDAENARLTLKKGPGVSPSSLAVFMILVPVRLLIATRALRLIVA